MVRVLSAVLAVAAWPGVVWAADPAPAAPMRACDVLRQIAAYDGKTVAVVGRFSFRKEGRTFGEASCAGLSQASMRIRFDSKNAPRIPERLDMDGGAVQKLIRDIRQSTALARFPFGTPEYDRWALVYGRVEANKDSGPQIVCFGDAEVVFVIDRP